MLFNCIWIPKQATDPSIRAEFDAWVDNLSQAASSGQIFMNSSEETARLLERAHPDTPVCLVRVDALSPFFHAYDEQMRKEMVFIENHCAAGGIVVFEPYRTYVFDGMRYAPKEVA